MLTRKFATLRLMVQVIYHCFVQLYGDDCSLGCEWNTQSNSTINMDIEVLMFSVRMPTIFEIQFLISAPCTMHIAIIYPISTNCSETFFPIST